MTKIFNKDASLLWNIRRIKYLPGEIPGYFHRAIHGWDYSDVWNINTWFMEVMPQMLQHLSSHGMGCPGDADHPTKEAWQFTLNHMIFLLKEMNEDTCSQRNEIWDAYWESNHKLTLDEDAFMTRFNEINQYRDKCKDEFFELFSKYFWNLWD